MDQCSLIELLGQASVSECPDCLWPGELLDLDGPVGGYNLQAAFSTGYLAGESV